MKRLIKPASLDLDQLLDRVPAEFGGFKKDKVYFVCDAIYKGGLSLDKETLKHPYKKRKYFVPLQSDILSHYLGTEYYTAIIDWMVAADIIEVDRTYRNKIVSLGYRFTEQYRHDKISHLDVTDKILQNKKPYKKKSGFKNSPVCDDLKKWYAGLKIDIGSAQDAIIHQYNNEMFDVITDKQWEKAIHQKNNSQVVLNLFSNGGLEEYHHQDESGRRLHTGLTCLPRHLRRYVTYKGEELAQTDLSNSQLFFTLFLFCAKNWTTTNQTNQLWVGLDYVPFPSIMCSVFKENMENEVITDDKFTTLVADGKLYDYFVKRMDNEDGFFTAKQSYGQKRERIKKLLIAQINGDPSIVDGTPKFYNFKAIGTEPKRKVFSEKKDVKNRKLYSGKNRLLWDAFNEDFPKVAAIYRTIKLYNNSDLSRVLQRIESTAVLDFACQEIGKELPEAPLFTIHDCLVTTTKYVHEVDVLLKASIAKYIGVSPKTKIMYWSEYEEVRPMYCTEE